MKDVIHIRTFTKHINLPYMYLRIILENVLECEFGVLFSKCFIIYFPVTQDIVNPIQLNTMSLLIEGSTLFSHEYGV